MLDYFSSKAFITSLNKKGSSFTLKEVTLMLDRLNNPQNKIKIIHVAGTNGKGSTITYLSNILTEAGFVVGCFMTPAVFDYNEIYKINNISISNDDFAKYFNKVYPIYLELTNEGYIITSFMIETCIAYLYFYEKNVDFAIIECGLGGKLDATNVEETNVLSVITQIDYDHTNVLGNTLNEIAENKCGIIRKNSTVITTKSNEKVIEIISKNARENNTKLVITSESKSEITNTQKITYNGKVFETKLLGSYQKINLPLAIESAYALQRLGYNITDKNIQNAIKNTKFTGRFEVLHQNPTFIIDGAHNPNASIYLQDYLKNVKQNITLIIGIFKDKDYIKILQNTVKYANKIYTFNWNNPRHLDGEKLASIIKEINPKCKVEFTTLNKAIFNALNEENLVVAFGSLSFLKDIKSIVEAENDR